MGDPAPHKARKRFGQHFLSDRNMVDRIVRAIDPSKPGPIVEIGPGQGALTLPLLKQCQSLIAVELDRDLIPILQQAAADVGELTLVNQDILTFDLNQLPGEGSYRLVGNLPYNISTPLMFHLLETADRIQDMHFMVQKEVAERIVADAGSRQYGRLGVMMQYHCECSYLFGVPPQCFSPPPKVESAIIRLLPRATAPYPIGNYENFAKVVQAAFQQRRKTIANGLKSLLDRQSIIAAGIDPGARAEQLSGEEFGRLSAAVGSG